MLDDIWLPVCRTTKEGGRGGGRGGGRERERERERERVCDELLIFIDEVGSFR